MWQDVERGIASFRPSLEAAIVQDSVLLVSLCVLVGDNEVLVLSVAVRYRPHGAVELLCKRLVS